MHSTTTLIFSRVVLMLFTGAAMLGIKAVAQSSPRPLTDVDMTSRRVLNDLLTQIENALKEPINFEEAAPLDSQWLERGATISMRPEALYPKRARLVVQFVPGEVNTYNAVQTVLNAYSRAHLPGNYAISQQNGFLSVLPIGSSANGRTTPALLLQTITIPLAERSIEDTFTAITGELSSASGKTVIITNLPFGDTQTRIQMKASNEPALVVLERVAQLLGPVSFHLVYDPSDSRYGLNIGVINMFPPEEDK